MVDAAFRYFGNRGEGHIAVISSIAAPRDWASLLLIRRPKDIRIPTSTPFEQLACMHGWTGICFTDIRPGFVPDRFAERRKTLSVPDRRPGKVARCIVRAIHRKQRMVVIDWRYRLLVGAWRCFPAGYGNVCRLRIEKRF